VPAQLLERLMRSQDGLPERPGLGDRERADGQGGRG
jgi:hypothetical protein